MTVVSFISAVGLFVICPPLNTFFVTFLQIVFVYYCVCFCRKHDQALEYHRQALVLIPQHASTYAAIGYVHSLMGDFESAIDYFHTV